MKRLLRFAELSICALLLVLPCIAADLETAVRESWKADDPLAKLARDVRAKPTAFTYIDLSIRVAREIDPSLAGEGEAAFRQELATLAAALRGPLAQAKDTREKAKAIATLLFEKHGLRTAGIEIPEKELAQHYFPHAVLKGKRGVCLGFTMIYLCLGERLDLPLVAAHAPQHIYVKWPHGDKAISIETTAGGRIYDEPDFRNRYRLTEREITENCYFQPIDQVAVVGDLLNGASWFSAIGTAKQRLAPKRAVLAAQLCVAIEPRNYNNWDTLAQAYDYAGDHQAALEALVKTNSMRPSTSSHTDTYWKERMERFKKAASSRP